MTSRQPASRSWASRRLLICSLLAVPALALESGAQATIISSAVSQPLAALAPNTLSVIVNSGATQTLTSLRDNAKNDFPTPVSITTSWNLALLAGRVNLEAYFMSQAQALVNGTNFIPSSRVRGRVITGLPRTFTAFTESGTGTVGTAGASLRLFSQLIVVLNRVDSRTDDLDLQLDLRGAPPLITGTYSGTITIRAVVQ